MKDDLEIKISFKIKGGIPVIDPKTKKIRDIKENKIPNNIKDCDDLQYIEENNHEI